MKKTVYIVLAMLLLFVVSCGENKEGKQTSKKYIIATDTVYPPFVFQENGQNVGIDVEVMNAIAKVEGLDIELRPMEFGGIIAALQSGQIDGAIAGANITEERKKAVDFSDPYYDTGIIAVINKDDNSIKELKDLEGKNIAVKNGTAGAKVAEEKLKGKANIRVYEETTTMFKAVENKQADAAFEDEPIASYIIKTTPGVALKIGTDKLTQGHFGFMVKKGANQELLAKFNEGLKKIRENGEYDKIVNKYTGK